MNSVGYVEYGFDAVVKYGGSLLMKPEFTTSSIKALEATLSHGKRILVIPGGGPTDKAIEAIDARTRLAPETHHRACARAQDQTGLMICDPAFGNLLAPCETLEKARTLSSERKIPVLLPSRILFAVDPVEKTWEITSDGIAIWFAWLTSTPLMAVLTDVDGIFQPASSFADSQALRAIRAIDLESWGATSVDRCVPIFARRRGIRVWVGHGGHPDRLSRALCGQETTGTFIDPQ